MKTQTKKEVRKVLVLTFLFFAILFVISAVQAITLEELLNSYSFDYYGEEIDIINVTDFMSGNYLFFNISISNATSGNYDFYIDLEDGEDVVVGDVSEAVSSSGGVVTANISTFYLSGVDQFNYTLRVYDSGDSLVYREGDYTTQVYSSYDPGYNVLGVVDSNINNNLLRLNITLNSSASSTENVSVFLQYGDRFISSTSEETLSSGLNYVILDMDNETIKSTHYSGDYNITGVSVGSKIIPLNLTTSSYDYEDFAKTSYFKNYSSFFIDLDSNNLVDYLQLNFTINVKQTGTYSIEADIYDLYDQYLTTVVKNQSLSVGEEIVSIEINGSDIYSSKLNGPYKISASRLISGSDIVDFEVDSYITNISSYYDFERPPLPDLNISINVVYNGSDNLINVTIWNIGTAPAFNVLVDVFDDDVYEDQDFYAILNASESHTFNFISNETTTNNSFVAVVDFDNLIDELNESNNVALHLSLTILEVSAENIQRDENITFNATVVDDNVAVQSVWLKIWEGIAEISNIVWQGFLSLVSDDLWSVEVETNESFPLGEVNYTIYANDSLGKEVNMSSSFTILPPDIHKFSHKNSLGDIVAWLGNEGNIVLKGQCYSGGSCDAPGLNSFIFRNSTNDNVAFINSTGDMCIVTGDCSDQSATCNPTRDAFIMRNSSNYNMSFIDFDGDLCLTGSLFENSEL